MTACYGPLLPELRERVWPVVLLHTQQREVGSAWILTTNGRLLMHGRCERLPCETHIEAGSMAY